MELSSRSDSYFVAQRRRLSALNLVRRNDVACCACRCHNTQSDLIVWVSPLMKLNARAPLLPTILVTLCGGFATAAFAQTPVSVVEYYNKTIASYFLTGRAAEQATLDATADFQRTGVSFVATAAAGAAAPLDGVCRYRIDVTGSSFSSHFYGRTADCALIASLNLPNFSNEGLDFAVEKPSAGACPASSPVPIYRALRTLTPVDVPNHRYSVSQSAYQEMLTRGWVGEGVVFCGRSATPATLRASFVASNSVINKCAVPRVGVSQYTGRAFPDMQGALDDEKSWLRSWSDETYLWYREIPDLNPDSYASMAAWFAAVKTPALALSGAPKDRFHFTEDTQTYEAGNAGVSYGYGIKWSAVRSSRPRQWTAAVVAPDSPAALAGVKRGDSIFSIDGVDFLTSSNTTALNAGLFPPTVGESHTFVLTPADGGAQKSVVLASAAVAIRPVPVSGIINTATGKVGYIAFTTFNTFTAEKAIADAFAGLARSGGITDLVLDLRYNGGGYLFIAAETAYMIAGNARTAGKNFEVTKSNDKKPFGPDDAEAFYNVGSGYTGGVAPGQPLPSLNLRRVFVLTSAASCSASESLINGLRGIDVEVILIGGQTCGKPYGFFATGNCGTTSFSIQFTGVNDKGAGDFIDGFAPTCAASDDLTKQLGDPVERQLAAALSYRSTGTCAPSSATDGAVKRTLVVDQESDSAVREFARPSDNLKLMTPSDAPRGGAKPIEPRAPTTLGRF